MGIGGARGGCVHAALMQSKLLINEVLGLSSIEGGGSKGGPASPKLARAALSSASLRAAVVWAAHSATRAAHEFWFDAAAPGAREERDEQDSAWGRLWDAAKALRAASASLLTPAKASESDES